MSRTADFPVLDAPRDFDNREYHRHIIKDFGYIDPYISEIDYWTSMPVRLIHDTAGGYRIELGPYSLSRYDVNCLREAIAAFNEVSAT